ncbi:MAG TPA: hypothetical protein VLS25_13895 [Dehalococcoidia bacterium]|nr:hypothetical protein [Dehalococcoidia bacterium]
MPTFRVYYAELEPKFGYAPPGATPGSIQNLPRDQYSETEWEDEVEADDAIGALDAFFRNHSPDRRRIGMMDDRGHAFPFEGFDFDPDSTYIWTEPGEDGGSVRLMEYQGIDEATPGMVTCPLCSGHGEVTEETAQEFDEVWSEEEDEEDASP